MSENHIVVITYLAGHFEHQNLAQCMKHLTGIAEVLGFIPTGNSENLFSCPRCQASSISDTGVFNIISPATQGQLIISWWENLAKFKVATAKNITQLYGIVLISFNHLHSVWDR